MGAGGVIIEVPAGHTETLSGRIELTATGTLADPIVIRKDPATSGANPVLTSYVGTVATPSSIADGFFILSGSDYVTIDGIDLEESVGNTTATTVMEFGYALFKASGTDGCQNNTIQNCTITLNRVQSTAWTVGHNGSIGIAVFNVTSLASAAVTVTAPSGSNSFNKFYSNTIQNCNSGIAFNGFTATTPYTFGAGGLGDTGNDVGGASLATGNNIINFGGGTGATNPCSAVFFTYAWDINVSYNTVNNNNGSGVNHPTTNRGIFSNAASIGASATINNNNITITGGTSTSAIDWAIDCEMAQSGAAGNTININNNMISITKAVVSTVALTAIWVQSAPTNLNINGNTISNFTYGGTSTSTTDLGVIRTGLAGIANLNINNNILSNVVTTGTTGAIFLIGVSGAPTATVNINGNQFNGLNTTGATTKSVVGISSYNSCSNRYQIY